MGDQPGTETLQYAQDVCEKRHLPAGNLGGKGEESR